LFPFGEHGSAEKQENKRVNHAHVALDLMPVPRPYEMTTWQLLTGRLAILNILSWTVLGRYIVYGQ
jgi:hypothetical protein